MNAVTLTTDQTRARLDQIRERLARVRADKWSHVFEPDGERIVVTRVVPDRDGRVVGHEAPATLVSFGPDVSWWEAEFIREAREDMDFVLDLLTEAGRTIRTQRAVAGRAAVDPRDKPEDDVGRDGAAADGSRDGAALPSPQRGEGGPKGRMRGDEPNLAAEASIKCTEPAFQRYLAQRHARDDDGDLSDSALAAAVLRRALGIGSRKDLNTDPEAAARWRDMRADFGEWMRP